ncbi:MAG: Holliday junction resolvase RuvX [Candidatus Syntrophonatronum acetioxidans]|uniref:Putative pre-16S rRNA nuclease n=1 Tax=Candidatus Syntrophonatronum acetioxidans TaxID=1795816 RepID=A0A424YHL7_9FIRM|nr:MAG: Holliday junction resolvase RuvX [Candidatus Syntrophonatronum acetioxidans]
MRVMALDLGEKTIGVAVSDSTMLIAQGVEIIKRKSLKKDLGRLQELLQEYQVEEVVVGLPLNMNGSEGPEAQKARDFGEKIKSRLKVPVIFWDERLTTMAAERTLLDADLSRAKRKKVIDKMAAVFILQNYLDRKRK